MIGTAGEPSAGAQRAQPGPPGVAERALRSIIDLSVTVLPCDAAGILVVENERLTTVVSSHPVVEHLDELQFELDEGPSLDAVSEGQTFHAVDLGGDARWPRFAPAAAGRGFRSVVACTLAGDRPRALTLYSESPQAFDDESVRACELSATVAGVAFDLALRQETDEVTSVQLRDALTTREMIGQAQGILMERERLTADLAFERLRRRSQNLNLKLREVARTLVETGAMPAD